MAVSISVTIDENDIVYVQRKYGDKRGIYPALMRFGLAVDKTGISLDDAIYAQSLMGKLQCGTLKGCVERIDKRLKEVEAQLAEKLEQEEPR